MAHEPDFTRQPGYEPGDEAPSNESANRTFQDVVRARMGRRGFLTGGLAAATAGLYGAALLRAGPAAAAQGGTSGLLGFAPVAVSVADTVTVPAGYRVSVLAPWGAPITGDMPAFSPANTGAEQAQQTGSHHDGLHFFPIDGSSSDGLLVRNHEYVEPRFLHGAYAGLELDVDAVVFHDGARLDDEVLKEMNGHGVSVVRVKAAEDGRWAVVPDPLNRRITALTPMALSGPVRGADLVKTKYSPDGTATRGTFANCAYGVTPWNTYMAAEENWANYFRTGDAEIAREHYRYGIRDASRYGWEKAAGGGDDYVRFDASATGADEIQDYRNEPNTFGWMVEIDPFDPQSTPVKRTHLGRFAHEGVVFAPAVAGRPVVCYSGDDARDEYIYKFVSRARYDPATADGALLDEGVLYVARFNDDGSGDWLALAPGEGGLTPENGFADLADILVNTRAAADLRGATKMDRPEWGAVDRNSGEVYFTLTNNSSRPEDGVDAANPRARNIHGHIVRWIEAGGDHAATRFNWELFVLAGDAATSADLKGRPLGDEALFSCPDGIWCDPDSRLWIQTDISDSVQNTGPFAVFGNNVMLAADPRTGEIRRFLTGPIGQEITGVMTTPDQTTMFVNVQHPGANTSPQDFAAGRFSSRWPDGGAASTPRSATLVITREDGGVIGA